MSLGNSWRYLHCTYPEKTVQRPGLDEEREDTLRLPTERARNDMLSDESS